MRALVVGAAPFPGADRFYQQLVQDAEFVVAADGGGSLCLAAGRVPDLWVGDFDSAPPAQVDDAERQGARVLRYPVDKDASDLDLALDAARAHDVTDVTFTAAFSARLDHTIAGIGTLFRSADLQGRALEPAFALYALDAAARPELTLGERPGTTLSLFAFDADTRVSATGVRYQLIEAALPRFTSLGLSNEAVSPVQHVRVLRGRVLVVVAYEWLAL